MCPNSPMVHETLISGSIMGYPPIHPLTRGNYWRINNIWRKCTDVECYLPFDSENLLQVNMYILYLSKSFDTCTSNVRVKLFGVLFSIDFIISVFTEWTLPIYNKTLNCWNFRMVFLYALSLSFQFFKCIPYLGQPFLKKFVVTCWL